MHEIVCDLNRKISLALPDQSTIVRSKDRVTDDAKHSWALLGEVAKCFPLYCLSLRTGDCVMVLRNLSNVLKNIVRAIVLCRRSFFAITDYCIGSAPETIHKLPRMKFIDDTFASGFDTKMTRVLLGNNHHSTFFSHGMLYVALSVLEAIRIACARTKDGQQTRAARNVVWPELLSQQPPAQLFEFPEERSKKEKEKEKKLQRQPQVLCILCSTLQGFPFLSTLPHLQII